MDVVYNPTPNWRMPLNVARQDTVQSNVAPVATEWLALMRSNYDAIAHLPYNGVNGQTVGARFASALYYVPVGVQPDGTVSQYRLPAYRTWMLTNTFSF